MIGVFREITRGVYLIWAQNGGRFPYSYSFLLRGSKRNILIDAGAGREAIREVRDEIGVDLVLLTHPHGDHFSCLTLLEGIPCIIPRAKWETVKDFSTLGKRFVHDDEDARKVWVHFMENTLGARPFVPSDTYREGDTYFTGEHELLAISMPGHTADHFAFLEVGSKILFSGDIDFTPFGPWYGHEESSIDDFLFSLKRVKEAKPEIIASSHVPPLTKPFHDELSRYENKIYQREEAIKDFYDEGLSLNKIVSLSPIYGGHPHLPELLAYFERVMIEKHLSRLGLAV